MENKKININNENYIKLSHLTTTSINLSTFETLMKGKEFVKETQLKLKKRGFADYFTALESKKNGLLNYFLETSHYVKNNFLNSNVYYNLPQNIENTLEIIEDKQSLNFENLKEKENYLNFYPNILKEYAKEGLYNLPTNVLNKFMKIGTKFVPELAGNHIIQFKHKNEYNYSIVNIYKLLNSIFNPTFSIISQPHIIETTNRLNMSLFFHTYVLKSKNLKKSRINFIERNKKRLEYLCRILTLLFKKSINITLNRLYKLTSESNMLAKTVGTLINKNKLRILKRKMFRKFNIVNPSRILDMEQYEFNSLFDTKTINPAQLAGLNLRVAGRVLSERVVPRKTVKSSQTGSLARGKATIVNKGSLTFKNKRGTFSVTVKTGHFVS